MQAIEATVKNQNRYFGKALSEIVGAGARLEAVETHLSRQDHKIDLVYRGVDKLLKAFSPDGGGMAAVEREG